MQFTLTLPFRKEILSHEVLQIIQSLSLWLQRFKEEVGWLWLYFFFLLLFELFLGIVILVIETVLVGGSEIVEVLFIGEHVEGLSGGGEGVDFVGHWADEFELDLVFELVEVVGLGDVFGEVVSGTE